MTRVPSIACVVVLLAFVSGACGDGDDDGTAGQEGIESVLSAFGEADEAMSADLVEQAEAEGRVSIYTANSDLEELIPVFEERFDVDVDLYRANSESILQRTMQELQAGRVEADLVENLLAEMELLAREDLFVPYPSPVLDDLRPEARFPTWTATRFSAFIVAWNTDVLGSTPPPTDWTDLADAELAPLVALEVGDFDWYMMLHQILEARGMPADEVDLFFESLASSARTVSGHTAQAELLSAGEFGLAASAYKFTIDSAAAEGAPVSWRPAVEPVIVKPAGIGVTRDAAHPAAAALFVDWMLTEGQELLVEQHRIPVSTAAGDPLEDVEVVAVDVDLLLEEGEEWSRRYEELVG